MLKVYNVVERAYFQGECVHTYTYHFEVIRDEQEAKEFKRTTVYQWDNFAEWWNEWWWAINGCYCNLFKKRATIQFFNKNLYIHRKKTPQLDWTVVTTLEETSVSLKRILEFDSELAAKYLVERGISAINTVEQNR